MTIRLNNTSSIPESLSLSRFDVSSVTVSFDVDRAGTHDSNMMAFIGSVDLYLSYFLYKDLFRDVLIDCDHGLTELDDIRWFLLMQLYNTARNHTHGRKPVET